MQSTSTHCPQPALESSWTYLLVSLSSLLAHLVFVSQSAARVYILSVIAIYAIVAI